MKSFNKAVKFMSIQLLALNFLATASVWAESSSSNSSDRYSILDKTAQVFIDGQSQKLTEYPLCRVLAISRKNLSQVNDDLYTIKVRLTAMRATDKIHKTFNDEVLKCIDQHNSTIKQNSTLIVGGMSFHTTVGLMAGVLINGNPKNRPLKLILTALGGAAGGYALKNGADHVLTIKDSEVPNSSKLRALSDDLSGLEE